MSEPPDDWYEPIYEAFTAEVEAKGIIVEDIRFSGFWSQGDGASFTGTVDLAKFIEAHDMAEAQAHWLTIAKAGFTSVSIARSHSHYCHENTISAGISIEDYAFDRRDFDAVRGAVIHTCMDRAIEEPFDAFEKTIQDEVRKLCRDLYRRLEKEYEYLTEGEGDEDDDLGDAA